MKLLDFLTDKAGIMAAIAATVLALLGTADVLAMALFKAPIVGTVELSSMLLVCVFFLGMAGAARDGDNISVDLVLNALSARARFAVTLFNEFCTLLFFVILTYLSWKLALHSYDKGDVMAGATNFTLWPFKSVAALGATLALLALIGRLWLQATNSNNIQSSEH